MTAATRQTTLTLPSDLEIRIVRDFAAPRALVFDAFTQRDQVPQWYGCAEMSLVSCEMDVRVGGDWRYVTRMPDGSQHAHSGTYKVIERPARLVYSERYEQIPGSEHEVALTFTEANGVTTLTMNLTYPAQQVRDGHLSSGFDRGLAAMFDRLEQVANAARAA